MPKLEGWSVIAPACLYGYVYNDERFNDGFPITTSIVQKLSIKEMFAITLSGTRYELGEPSVHFLRTLESHGYKLESYEMDTCD